MTCDGQPPAGPGEEKGAAGGDEEEGDTKDKVRFGHGVRGMDEKLNFGCALMQCIGGELKYCVTMCWCSRADYSLRVGTWQPFYFFKN